MPTKVTAVLSAALLAAALAACSGGGGEESSTSNEITVWTLEDLDARMAVQNAIVADFTKKTGIKVKLVGVGEDQFSQTLTAAAAADDLPDAIGALPLSSVREMEANELLDTETPGRIVDRLGRDTFSPRALELDTSGGKLLAVPSDGWAQLILYRKDLFEKAGLQPPDTYEALQAAAAKLNTGGVAGITLAVAQKDSFTAQSFEHVALANGCQLVDNSGNVTLDSPQCARAFEFYGNLARNYSVKGKQDVDSTRATYFSGKAAMTIWSSFILDELAGLRKDALPSCPECREDPEWLAKNTGVVTALKGPDGSAPAQYGEIVSWVVTRDAAKDPASTFVSYMMNEGYERWIGMAPEGKFPTRKGFDEKWDKLPAGVDSKKPLADVYPADVLTALRKSPDTFARWGIPQGQGKLVGATMGELPVPKAVSAVADGTLTPQAAAAQAKADVETIKRGIRQ
ncbi:ABC-type sugar transport system, periplasmic binding protein YcjN [[Actinomadura] parvosata subsp. kistnae]|uniref:Bicyclomycin resistance protein n=1 Tax=[Actinomadura] parvosata subsp. kistnae TaxID=1909395 RepID=A0A1V0A7W1_9ACTN|nr:extracellular solute-binding protein [Nonomuraea sp. ATCC 55076]AQZ66284.1 bicyclomycin resistance protein [Nonomuraea sp. ATCC 55076]SPL95706.1 ABC-type sugar transport system, periplasmic binding protein YcjN [Actinomadura parvosata subsp. kistnae]